MKDASEKLVGFVDFCEQARNLGKLVFGNRVIAHDIGNEVIGFG